MSSIGSFNPLPHAEGDLGTELFRWKSGVSIHSLTQRETWKLMLWLHGEVFQSTPSRRGRLGADLIRTSSTMFQSTPSRRGRQCI